MKEVSRKRKTGALLIALIMVLTTLVPAGVFAETPDADSETGLESVQPGDTKEQGQENAQTALVEKVELNHSQISLKVGNKAVLKASVSPSNAQDQTVEWSSSDSKTASVDQDGRITAKKAGRAVITAKAGESSASCTIHISLTAPKKVKTKITGTGTIQLTWKSVKGADGYEIYCAKGESKKYTKTAVVKGKTVYKDKNKTIGTEYAYKIRAYSGKNYSAFSGKVKRMARPFKPEVSLNAGEEQIKLSWKSVKGADGYRIYRAEAKSGDYIRIATLPAEKREFTNIHLKGGKKYFYKMRAYKVTAEGKVFSHCSDEKSIKAKKVKMKTHKKGFEYKKKMTVKAYAYTGGGRTAMGTRARVGAIAVDPNVIPLGTDVYVEGYGHARAEDTGGNIKGQTVDLYMNSHSSCMRWGVRYKTVYVNVRK